MFAERFCTAIFALSVTFLSGFASIVVGPFPESELERGKKNNPYYRGKKRRERGKANRVLVCEGKCVSGSIRSIRIHERAVVLGRTSDLLHRPLFLSSRWDRRSFFFPSPASASFFVCRSSAPAPAQKTDPQDPREARTSRNHFESHDCSN